MPKFYDELKAKLGVEHEIEVMLAMNLSPEEQAKWQNSREANSSRFSFPKDGSGAYIPGKIKTLMNRYQFWNKYNLGFLEAEVKKEIDKPEALLLELKIHVEGHGVDYKHVMKVAVNAIEKHAAEKETIDCKLGENSQDTLHIYLAKTRWPL